MSELTHQGTKTTETDRLILRQFALDDAEDMFNTWANDDEVTKYLTWLPHLDIEASRSMIDEWSKNYAKDDFYLWAMVLKGSGQVIGSIGYNTIDDKACKCEVGYCMGRDFWNRGLMTEALRAVIDFGFNQVGFNRIGSYHAVENLASGKVMQKAGMNYEGCLRGYYATGQGKICDANMYAILQEDYYRVRVLKS